eukprot:scaffold203246_cov33-Prasinocladus_malaysianus.AAC.1
MAPLLSTLGADDGEFDREVSPADRPTERLSLIRAELAPFSSANPSGRPDLATCLDLTSGLAWILVACGLAMLVRRGQRGWRAVEPFVLTTVAMSGHDGEHERTGHYALKQWKINVSHSILADSSDCSALVENCDSVCSSD